MKEIFHVEKDMGMEQSMIVMEKLYLKGNILIIKKKVEKNIVKVKNYLKENFYLIKNGMEKDMMKMEMLYMNQSMEMEK